MLSLHPGGYCSAEDLEGDKYSNLSQLIDILPTECMLAVGEKRPRRSRRRRDSYIDSFKVHIENYLV